MTVDEIHERFDSEWVLLGDPVVDDKLKVLSGTVLYHSKDREEVYKKAIELRVKRIATIYTGPTPEHIITRLLF